VVAAERRTFATIDARALPPADREFARRAAASASADAFHLAMGIGSGLLVLAGVGGGIGLRPRRVGGDGPGAATVTAGECGGGQFTGAPAAAGTRSQPAPSSEPAGAAEPT
jgi:hypothetical protein